MDDMDEVKELLREIRDLQKAHFERYKAFTQTILTQEQAGRMEQSRFLEESRRTREESRQRANRDLLVRVVVAVVAVGSVVLALAWTFVTSALQLWGP